MADALPDTLVVNSSTYTKQATESLTDGTHTTIAWASYTDGSAWLVRIAKPDNAASPTAWFYDQIAEADAIGVSTLEWCMACIQTSATLWND